MRSAASTCLWAVTRDSHFRPGTTPVCAPSEVGRLGVFRKERAGKVRYDPPR
jgi:hypothetical protein